MTSSDKKSTISATTAHDRDLCLCLHVPRLASLLHLDQGLYLLPPTSCVLQLCLCPSTSAVTLTFLVPLRFGKKGVDPFLFENALDLIISAFFVTGASTHSFFCCLVESTGSTDILCRSSEV